MVLWNIMWAHLLPELTDRSVLQTLHAAAVSLHTSCSTPGPLRGGGWVVLVVTDVLCACVRNLWRRGWNGRHRCGVWKTERLDQCVARTQGKQQLLSPLCLIRLCTVCWCSSGASHLCSSSDKTEDFCQIHGWQQSYRGYRRSVNFCKVSTTNFIYLVLFLEVRAGRVEILMSCYDDDQLILSVARRWSQTANLPAFWQNSPVL